MAAPQYTGSVEELPDILGSWNAHERLAAWRDAAVARHLAEAGAVHPAVHTPTRIMNYLESHGWERTESPEPLASPFWSLPEPNRLRWVKEPGIELDAPLCDDLPDYADVVRVVVNRIAWAEQGSVTAPNEVRAAILLEISSMPDEVAW